MEEEGKGGKEKRANLSTLSADEDGTPFRDNVGDGRKVGDGESNEFVFQVVDVDGVELSVLSRLGDDDQVLSEPVDHLFLSFKHNTRSSPFRLVKVDSLTSSHNQLILLREASAEGFSSLSTLQLQHWVLLVRSDTPLHCLLVRYEQHHRTL